MHGKVRNIVWHEGHVSREDRAKRLGQTGATIWLTGLPSSGKSTLAFTLEHALIADGYLAYVLDGDNVRHGLNKDLGFSPADRVENIRRIAEVAKLFADAGFLVITSFISPYRSDRDEARRLHREFGLPFIEIYIEAPIEVCETRDPKGLYKKARAGLIKDFTGINAPYEPPIQPELIISTDKFSPEEETALVLAYLKEIGMLGENREG